MKNLRKILGLLLLTLTSCQKMVAQDFLHPNLSESFAQFASQNPSKIYYILSWKMGNDMIVTLGTSNSYSYKFTDYYTEKDSILITYYSIDSIFDSQLINVEEMTKYHSGDKLDYPMVDFLANCIHKDSMLVVNNDSIYPLTSKSFASNAAKDTDVFSRTDINVKINSFINTQLAPLYELRFFYVGEKAYISISGNFYYDKDKSDAYFYRNGHLVVISGLTSIPANCKYDKAAVRLINGGIAGARGYTKENYILPMPDVYEIKKNNLKLVAPEKAFSLIFRSLRK